jgi:aspartate carbamoyltransferase regulatory subunit
MVNEQAIISLSRNMKYMPKKVLDLLENHEIRGSLTTEAKLLEEKSGMLKCKNHLC